MTMPRPLIELVIALAVIAISIVGLFEAASYEGTSGYLPKAVLSLSILLSLFWALQSLLWMRRESASVASMNTESMVKLVFFLLGTLAYVLLIPVIGFFITTLVFIPVISLMLGYRKRLMLTSAPIVFVAVVYLIFVLVLKIPFPEAILL